MHQRPAVVERPRPGTGRFGCLRPSLPHKRGEHARLRQRGFADAGIAEQDRELVGRRFERPDHLDGLAPAAEEKIRVRLGHGGEAAIGRSVPPQFARQLAAAGGCVYDLCDALLRRRVGGDDPMQLPQERQSGRRLAVQQHEDDRKIGLLHPAVESFVVFDDLPRSESLFPDQAARRRLPRRCLWPARAAKSRRRAGSSAQRKSWRRSPCAVSAASRPCTRARSCEL